MRRAWLAGRVGSFRSLSHARAQIMRRYCRLEQALQKWTMDAVHVHNRRAKWYCDTDWTTAGCSHSNRRAGTVLRACQQ